MNQPEYRSPLHSLSRSWLFISLCLVGALLAILASRGSWRPTGTGIDSPVAEATHIRASLAELPLSFISNAGQSDPQVHFQVRGAGHTIFFTPEEVVFSASRRTEDESPAVLSVVRLRFDGADPSPVVEGIKQLPGVANFFIGNEPSRWRSGVATYGGVAYRELYPGVDLVYRGNEGQLKSEFVVSPGVNPKVIELEYRGMESIRVGGDGALTLETVLGELVEEAPVVYQEIAGKRLYVEGQYVLLGSDRVGFEVGGFDRSHPLVIDPTLVYSTYLGGASSDGASDKGIAVDGNNNAYVTGGTNSTDFPTQNPIQGSLAGVIGGDIFVSKLNASGTALVYSTYLGGSGMDASSGIAVDDSGNTYVTGRTGSTDFPTQNPIQGSYGGGPSDAFVSKLNASGTALVYSTYLGGSNGDLGSDIAVDDKGSAAYVMGETNSTDFPTQNPIQGSYGGGPSDAFVSKLNASGTALVYSTYLGGSEGDGGGHDIAVDGSGNAYVMATTDSLDFPTRNPIQASNAGGGDAFVSKMNALGTALIYSTYLGGSDLDFGAGIAVDGRGNAYVTGLTSSTDFPMQNPIQGSNAGSRDAFVSKLNASGTALVYSTYLGGSGIDQSNGIAVDGSGNAYVAGGTRSTDFPTQNPIQGSNAGGNDAIIAKIAEPKLVNDLVTFEPDPATFSTSDDTTGCPPGYAGKFNFESSLTNISSSTLTELLLKVQTLTRHNLLLTEKGLIGQGDSFMVPTLGFYADGQLSPGEFVDVPFVVCLRTKKTFRLLVNVLGGDLQHR